MGLTRIDKLTRRDIIPLSTNELRRSAAFLEVKRHLGLVHTSTRPSGHTFQNPADLWPLPTYRDMLFIK